MARIRSTHPGQWTAGDFLECSPLARLLALALRNVADDHGVFRWKPKTIKAECLPADNCDIDQLLLELVTNDQVKRYAAEGKEYGLIVDFTQWQRPKKPKYLHPVPDWFSTGTEPVPNEEDTEPEITPQRKEVGGRMKKEPSSASPSSANEDFQNLKKSYPKRAGNYGWKAAERKFNSLVKTGVDPKAIIAAAVRLGETLRSKVGTEFIPMPASWLNSEDFLEIAVASFADPLVTDWDSICANYKKFGLWSRHAPGGDPDSHSCQCPREILEKHGIPYAPASSSSHDPPPGPILRTMQ